MRAWVSPTDLEPDLARGLGRSPTVNLFFFSLSLYRDQKETILHREFISHRDITYVRKRREKKKKKEQLRLFTLCVCVYVVLRLIIQLKFLTAIREREIYAFFFFSADGALCALPPSNRSLARATRDKDIPRSG